MDGLTPPPPPVPAAATVRSTPLPFDSCRRKSILTVVKAEYITMRKERPTDHSMILIKNLRMTMTDDHIHSW
ncbi:hypothetical protein C5167_023467 [Papaver somniferum]|uniref:Uncharacterized protein n=1 Tax=Papaver somniferum TaxID=3469 RepID=A0A4Y7JKW2_PAPSO|nr:hypothetical protein C5167_023467 [Papaver somniferum]